MKFKVFLMLSLLMFFGITANAEYDSYIIKLNDSVQLFSADGETNNKDYISVPTDELQDYIDAGIVEYYEPDYTVELFAPVWNLNSVKVDFPHYISCVGTDVRIGIIDSGIGDGVAPNVIPGYNYIDDSTDTSDDTMHGTWVSSIATSSRFGVAINARFVPLKCFKKGVDTKVSHILDAIVDAVDVYDCDVINMSFGIKTTGVNIATNSTLRLLKEKVDYAISKGAILVASVGNDYDATIRYPAAFDNVIGVGSVNKDGVRSEFSNYNYSVHVVAPGEKVWGPYISDGEISQEYIYQLDGTSFSAPHVSGLAAIVKSMDRDITQAEFAQLLVETSVETSADKVEGWDENYGYGMIDCEAMVKKLIEGQIIHISPIWKVNNAVNAMIYNNTPENKKVFCVCAYYDENDRMLECIPTELEIDGLKTYLFKNSLAEGYVKYMVLSDDGKLMPLAVAKDKENISTGDVPTGGNGESTGGTGATTGGASENTYGDDEVTDEL